MFLAFLVSVELLCFLLYLGEVLLNLLTPETFPSPAQLKRVQTIYNRTTWKLHVQYIIWGIMLHVLKHWALLRCYITTIPYVYIRIL